MAGAMESKNIFIQNSKRMMVKLMLLWLENIKKTKVMKEPKQLTSTEIKMYSRAERK